MGDAMSFRLEKNHGAADAIDCNQVGVNLVHAIAMQNVHIFSLAFTNSSIWFKLILIRGNSKILFSLCTLQDISKVTYDE
jgi:hypothetical protein